jgi:hypothetical protein
VTHLMQSIRPAPRLYSTAASRGATMLTS